MDLSPTIIIAFAGACSALFAAVSAGLSLRATRLSRHNSEAQIFLSFREKYGSLEMVQALQHLAATYRDDNEQFAADWMKKYRSYDKDAEELFLSRRYVGGYYMSISRLYHNGYISKDLVRELLSHNATNVLFKIVEPMEKQLWGESWPRDDFDRLRKIKSAHGAGKIVNLRSDKQPSV